MPAIYGINQDHSSISTFLHEQVKNSMIQPLRRVPIVFILGSMLLLTLLVSQPTPTVYAQSYVVTTLANSGAASLRDAILNANVTAADDVITFTVSGTISLLTDLPPLNNNGSLTINGNNAIIVTRASATSFDIFSISTSAVVTLNGLTITNGSSGGINNFGALTLTNSTVSNNAGGNAGGGIINNNGSLTIRNSTIRENTATTGAGINNSGALTIVNSTVSGNIATSLGGGIYTGGSFSSATITHTTVTGNSAGTASGGVRAASGPLTIRNSIIANNSAANAGTQDCARSGSTGVINAENTLIETGLTCLSNGTSVNNLTGDPNLGPAAGNPSYFLLASPSSALNAGNNALIPGGVTTDQAGNARIFGGTVDLGAVERGATASISGGVSLQGRLVDLPNPAYAMTFSIRFTRPGETTPFFTTTFTADQFGGFTLGNIPVGTYDLRLKNSHTLAVGFGLPPLAEGDNGFSFGVFREGDADDNNLVNILDFSLLATSFGKAAADVGFNATTDFNEDDIVNINDFSLLATNFGQEGAP